MTLQLVISECNVNVLQNMGQVGYNGSDVKCVAFLFHAGSRLGHGVPTHLEGS